MEPVGEAPTRAGRCITQPTGYRAFMPALLPPQPALALGGELQGGLSAADRALGRLDGSVLTLSNPDISVFMCSRKEAVVSSQIEGTQSSVSLSSPDVPLSMQKLGSSLEAMNG